ncbi:MAG TPA: EutN/CcmL family microcompartment protein [Terriglobales bacterium]|nr:EutN/CcmL family microcompartment protein [Terriglobales bacterium]
MILARVIGEVVASQKHPSHSGMKLLRVQPENVQDTPPFGVSAAGLIALDAVGAGIGERVLVVLDGFAAMSAVERPLSPIDAAVVGVVDHADLA